jgi:vacuole morphology and inheritance protein 14
MEKLSQNKLILNSKGQTILKKFCSVLSIQKVYLQIADVLFKMKDPEFISNMISILDIFLLTDKETEELRNQLREIKKSGNPEIKTFFEKIYMTWCFNPISTLKLCMLCEYFELSYHLILKL